MSDLLNNIRAAQVRAAEDVVLDSLRSKGLAPAAFDLLAHLQRQREWSERTFGPGPRTAGVVDHIRKELCEIEAAPGDITEWIDVVILALDGAWRAGARPQQIIDAIVAKQTKNEGRAWPDWRTADPNKAIEHVRNDPAVRCTSCGHCGMDMDMDPFCVAGPVLATAKERFGRSFNWGLGINSARPLCQLVHFVPRVEVKQ